MKNYYDFGADEENAAGYNIYDNSLITGEITFLPHYHDSIEILIITSGEGTASLSGKTFDINKGTVVFVNSRQVHFLKTSTSLTYDCIVIQKHFLKKYGFPYRFINIKNNISDEKVFRLCGNIFSNDKVEYKDVYCEACVVILLSELFEYYTKSNEKGVRKENSKKVQLVTEVMDFVSDNATTPFSVDDIGKKMKYSKYYLCRIFKEITNQTIIEYSNRIKCLKAKEDLLTGEYTVFEVSLKYNFENYSYFTKIFKKYIGDLPSHFKK